MIIRKSLCVLEDGNGLSVCAIVGMSEFVYDSIKQTIKEFCESSENPESLKGALLAGNLVFVRHYLDYIHDNTPLNNKSISVNKCIKFPVEKFMELEFGSREYCKEFETQLNEFYKVDCQLKDKSKNYEEFNYEYKKYDNQPLF